MAEPPPTRPSARFHGSRHWVRTERTQIVGISGARPSISGNPTFHLWKPDLPYMAARPSINGSPTFHLWKPDLPYMAGARARARGNGAGDVAGAIWGGARYDRMVMGRVRVAAVRHVGFNPRLGSDGWDPMGRIRWLGSDGWDPVAGIRWLCWSKAPRLRAFPYMAGAVPRRSHIWQVRCPGVPIYGRCGAQADAAQALSKLRANRGMVVPLEAYAAVAQIHG